MKYLFIFILIITNLNNLKAQNSSFAFDSLLYSNQFKKSNFDINYEYVEGNEINRNYSFKYDSINKFLISERYLKDTYIMDFHFYLNENPLKIIEIKTNDSYPPPYIVSFIDFYDATYYKANDYFLIQCMPLGWSGLMTENRLFILIDLKKQECYLTINKYIGHPDINILEQEYMK